ncbi:MAG TPA: condensation domain-containing protein, partial [Longimicrobiaceae bacterium]|nr:condensation domain-containing protein [Longimicrobiaceae bacterium]
MHQLAPGSAAYHMPHPLRLSGALDPAALERSLTELVRRHESLRTVFAEVDGEGFQVVRPAAPVALALVDLGGLPAEAREREIRRRVAEESLRPFDLAAGPLLRALLVRLDAGEHGLLFTLHHIIADGWSLGVLVREVSALYAAAVEGREPRLPALPVQYADYAAWQREWLQGEALERQLGYWREQLGGAPPLLELPTDRPRPPVPGEAGASLAFTVPAERTGALRTLARREGATLFMALLAAFQTLLARWSGQDDVSAGTPTAGRSRVELEGLIGMFVNTLVLRTRLAGGPGFRALLHRVRETTLGAYAHQEVPFEKLVEELDVERSLRHTPLFQAMFALQNLDTAEPELAGVRLAPLGGSEEAAKFDLRLTVMEVDEELRGVLSYRRELFDPATVERMAEHFRILLDAVVSDSERPVMLLPLMPEAERRRVLSGWNDAAARDYPRGACVHELFAEQAARTPGAPALVCRGETLTYAELERRANRLANHLRGRGVGPERCVGVSLERTPELVTALLAVLKAGGAYVPLDPAYPRARLA